MEQNKDQSRAAVRGEAVAECRDDGRCQYAIDHGAEGMGHCPVGKCCMPVSARAADAPSEPSELSKRLRGHARLFKVGCEPYADVLAAADALDSQPTDESQWVDRCSYDAQVDEWAIERSNLEAEIERLKSAAPMVADPAGVALPPLPELESLDDLTYAQSTPAEWDTDYRSTWQKLQIESRNSMQWRVYALRLRDILAAATIKAVPSEALDSTQGEN